MKKEDLTVAIKVSKNEFITNEIFKIFTTRECVDLKDSRIQLAIGIGWYFVFMKSTDDLFPEKNYYMLECKLKRKNKGGFTLIK
jgi:hypothetical protein